MAGFGGAIKLTGESEYRKALSNITASLKVTASEMKVVATQFSKSDTSTQALAARTDVLNKKLSEEQQKYSALQKQLSSFVAQQKKNEEAHSELESRLEKEKKVLAEVESQYGKTSKEYKEQKKVVEDLEAAVKKSSQTNEANEKTIKKTEVALNNAQAEINKTENELRDLEDAAKDSAKAAQNSADGGFTVFKGMLADLASKAVSAAVEGLKRLGSALVDTGKQALASYAQYEQLVGGVDTLFKDSSKQVQEYAAQAYKTAGMSANTYMETVTSFSATLLQGLGNDTKKAAEYADMAIIDMADNANKMGTSMESIQYAYQGFAKDNYTMLDNLKLGYGGTQSEMARLVNESGVMGKAFKATAQNVKDIPFDKLIEAIHKTQEKMGITGTTAKEASSTIEGSVNSMKAAWSNLLTAIADDNADMSKSVNEFVDSAVTAGKNVVPRIKQIIDGIKTMIGTLVSEVFPKLKKEIPELAPIIEPFEWILNNYKMIVTAIKAVIAAFVVTKIVSFAAGVVDTTKAMITAVKAADGFAGAMKGLNAALGANPFALVAGLIAGVGVAIAGVIATSNEAEDAADRYSKHLEEQTEAINANKDSWNELKNAQQESLNADLTMLTNVQNLKDELLTLVDANGKVKEGYEGRVGFILNQLNSALGTEYNLTDGVIQKYGELKSSIDELIAKKKAEAILNAQQALYQEAITKQADAYARLNQIKAEGEATAAKYNELEERHNQLLDAGVSYSSSYMIELRKQMDTLKEQTETSATQYQEQLGLLDEYAYNIGTYETNMALAHEGRYDEMTTATWEYVKETQKAGDAEEAQLEKNVTTTDTQLKHLEKLYKDSGDETYKTQIDNAKKKQTANVKALNEYSQSTKKGLDQNSDEWLKNAQNILKELTDGKIEFKNVGEDQIEMYVDGMKAGETMSKDEAKKVAKDTLHEFDKKAEAQGMGKNLITGFANGTGNMSLWNVAKSTASNFAVSILETLKKKFGIASPSKETKKMGRFLLQGLGIGMEDEEKDILDQAEGFGESVLEAMNEGLSGGLDTSAISGIKNAIPTNLATSMRVGNASAVQTSELTGLAMISAFKQALSEMKIEMDDYEMGKFVDKTVSRAIYS